MSRRYSRTPAGLYLPLRATLAGRVRWQVLDERGVPEIPRTPSGIPVGPVEGVEQDNLITNHGLDRLAEQNFSSTNISHTTAWRRRLAIGTGSTAPDVTDTTLDNEVQRATTSGAFDDGSSTYYADEVANDFVAEILITRLATVTADRNLTEFGFSQLTAEDIVIRELLRDGGGTPITVSLLEGKTLRVDHTLEVRIPAPVAGKSATIDLEEYDAGNNLIETTPYDVVHGPVAAGFAWQAISGVFTAWRPDFQSNSHVFARIASAYTYDRGGSGPPVELFGPMTIETYQLGTYTRRRSCFVPTGSGNATWHGFSGRIADTGRQYVVVFENPETYTKVDTDTLQAGFVSAWARA